MVQKAKVRIFFIDNLLFFWFYTNKSLIFAFLLNRNDEKETSSQENHLFMKTVTLISDWKLKDPYVAMFKAKLASMLPGAQQYDITHAIDLFNIEQTAFILKNSYSAFPAHTLHIILTDAPMANNIFPVLVEYDKHYFLGEDNGIFSMMFDNPEQLRACQYHPTIDNNGYTDKLLEMARWLFTDQLQDHTSPYSSFKLSLKRTALYEPQLNKITGRVAYIDAVCNAVTDIPVSMFEEVRNGRPFVASLPSSPYLRITKCYEHYNKAEKEAFLVYNQLGYVEIAMYRSNVAVLADIKVDDVVEIVFG